MFIWCGLLFLLGIMAFVDSLLNMGEIFRQINSVLFMLISLGLLLRTTTKMRSREREEYEKRVFAMEKELEVLKNNQKQLAQY